MMGRIAGLALSTAFIFLIVVAIMLNSGALFYMGTALMATIGASRLQAWLSVRGLRFERSAPERASIGELVTVEMIVWSERRIRRPLVTVDDHLPSRLSLADRSYSLPIAPAFDVPIRTFYRFRPLRRGKFRWSQLRVIGTDALGLVRMDRTYSANTSELTILPNPIPLFVPFPPASGWGVAEAESGKARGAGLEPRGVREYSRGDSIRFVHWRSSARAGKLLVKEFETGSQTTAVMVLQRQIGTDAGDSAAEAFEIMIGQAAYVADELLRQGIQVEMPTMGVTGLDGSADQRRDELLEALASTEADQADPLSAELGGLASGLYTGSTFYVFVLREDAGLPDAVRQVRAAGSNVVAILYGHDATRGSRLPAANGSFAESLRGAGALIEVVEEHSEVAA